MQTQSLILKELALLLAAYRAGKINVSSLASRGEQLVEAMNVFLPVEKYSRAMNSIYLFEEINAVVSDERRRPTQSERKEIEAELSFLEKIFFN